MEGKTLFWLVTAVQIVGATYDFTYDQDSDLNPSHWKYTPGWGHCGGKQQSPIDINTQLTSEGNDTVSLLTFASPQVDGHFENNGHAPTFLIDTDSVGSLQVVSQGKLYNFRNLHFHFGVHLGNGSEHSVDGKFYPAEAHLVHTGTEEGGVSIVVIGVFLSLQGDDSTEPTELTRIVGDYIEKIKHPHDKTPAEIMPYAILPKNLHYYTYSGSLTTPPCTEHVRWIVMQEPIIISQESITTLRSLYNEKGLMSEVGNRRPIQRMDAADVSVGELKKMYLTF